MKRTKAGNQLAVFGNALREVLGLEPLFKVQDLKRKPNTDIERFYIPAFQLPAKATSRKAA